MPIVEKLQRFFDTAYRGKRIGITYDTSQAVSTLESIVQSLGEFLILYAAYSDLTYKFLEVFPIARPSMWGRILTSAVGMFICGHKLLSLKENGIMYRYAKIPRIVAGIIIWPIAGSLLVSAYDLLFSPNAAIGPYSSSFQMPRNEWKLYETNVVESAETRVYSAQVKAPTNATKFKHLRVFIQPLDGYILLDVQPSTNAPVRKETEPMELGTFEESQSEWIFPNFDEAMQWQLVVTLGKANSVASFPNAPPISAVIFFHEE